MIQSNENRRKLAEYNIAGTIFQIDMEHLAFHEKQNPDNWFNIVGFKFEEETNILFDTDKKQVVRKDLDINTLPSHIKKVALPPLGKLDPIGLARFLGFKDDHYIKKLNLEPLKDRAPGKRLAQNSMKQQKGRRI